MKRTFVLPVLALATMSLGALSSCNTNSKDPVASLEAKPLKTEFSVGGSITREDVSVTFTYKDGTEEKATDFHFGAGSWSYTFKISDLGEKEMTVYAKSSKVTSYRNASFRVNVKAEPTIEKLEFCDFSTSAPYTCSVKRKNDSIEGYVIIPETYKTDDGTVYTVTKIATEAFEGCQKIDGIYLPKTIKSIESKAFSRCQNLTMRHAPSIYISHCTQLESVGSWAFDRFGHNPTLPDSVKSIGSYAFFCNMGSVSKLPESLESIGSYAFMTNSIGSLTIPKNVTFIGGDAFDSAGVGNLTIDSPTVANFTSNNSELFTKAKTVRVKNSISLDPTCYINLHYDQTSTESDYKIYGEKSLVFNIIDSTNHYCEVMAGNCSGDITIPSTTSIGGTTYTITQIGSSAFKESNITSVHIPSTVKTIKSGAFNYWLSTSPLKNAYFASTAGWTAGSTSINRYDLEKPTVAATYLTDTYATSTWTQA